MAFLNSDQWVHDRPHQLTAKAATDGTNATLVTITLRNAMGGPGGGKWMRLWLGDTANGIGLTATTASGAVGDKTAGTTGTVMGVLTTKKALLVQTTAAGTYQLSITDTAKTPFYVHAEIDGVLYANLLHLQTASYG
jgi:hypothetical protein